MQKYIEFHLPYYEIPQLSSHYCTAMAQYIDYLVASFLETIDTNSDEAFNDINELDDEEETTETSEPSKDIDLGSVQEV